MIVDDNADILESTKLLLEMLDYEVVTVQRAEHIMSQMKATKPEIVLQDFHMPNFDAKAHIARVRADPDVSTTPIVLFTASVENEQLWREVGADGLIFKPFDVEMVKDTIQAYVARGASARRSRPGRTYPP
jgi:DNA-binding response OmpR family regulator